MADQAGPDYDEYVRRGQTVIIDALGTLDPDPEAPDKGFIHPGAIKAMSLVIAGLAHDLGLVSSPKEQRALVKSIGATIDKRIAVIKAHHAKLK
jgi:hypothetical protein